jgi:hypothetical protein
MYCYCCLLLLLLYGTRSDERYYYDHCEEQKREEEDFLSNAIFSDSKISTAQSAFAAVVCLRTAIVEHGSIAFARESIEPGLRTHQ